MHFFVQSNGAAGHALLRPSRHQRQTKKTTSENRLGLVLSHLSSLLLICLKIYGLNVSGLLHTDNESNDTQKS